MHAATVSLQNEVMKEVLSESGAVRVMASEEDDGPIEVPSSRLLGGSSGCRGGGFAVVFDPLDGSRNIEVSIPTGGRSASAAAVGADGKQGMGSSHLYGAMVTVRLRDLARP